jgi:pyruvate formate-lyase activating enzyme-like uncharacterized protein
MGSHYSVKCSSFIPLNAIIFRCMSKHVDVFVPFCTSKTKFIAEIRLLHSQPFANGHFHFLLTVEFAALLQWTEQ